MGSPVWGLRPMRALRWALTARPRFGMTNLPAPPLHSFTANLKSSSKNVLIVFFGVSHFSARWPTILDLLIGFAISFFLSSCSVRFLRVRFLRAFVEARIRPRTRDTIKRVPAQRKRKCKKAPENRWLAIATSYFFSCSDKIRTVPAQLANLLPRQARGSQPPAIEFPSSPKVRVWPRIDKNWPWP